VSSIEAGSERATELPSGGTVDWPDWYAEYLVREQAGEELPT
jgi:hypothetical protein